VYPVDPSSCCGCHLESQQLLKQRLKDHPQECHQQRRHLAWHVSGDGEETCCRREDLLQLMWKLHRIDSTCPIIDLTYFFPKYQKLNFFILIPTHVTTIFPYLSQLDKKFLTPCRFENDSCRFENDPCRFENHHCEFESIFQVWCVELKYTQWFRN